MQTRDWTGSTSALPTAIRELAVALVDRAEQLGNVSGEGAIGEVAAFLRDEAYTLSEWADAVEQLYARLDATTRCAQEIGEPIDLPNAQLLTLGRIAAYGGPTYAYMGGLSVRADMLGVTSPLFPNGGCGIEPDGAVTS